MQLWSCPDWRTGTRRATLRAVADKTGGDFNSALHPRSRDGKFRQSPAPDPPAASGGLGRGSLAADGDLDGDEIDLFADEDWDDDGDDQDWDDTLSEVIGEYPHSRYKSAMTEALKTYPMDDMKSDIKSVEALFARPDGTKMAGLATNAIKARRSLHDSQWLLASIAADLEKAGMGHDEIYRYTGLMPERDRC